ncbi:AgmX/PglI C-terminal domain-containing protein [Polyangium jinanense]|uniref:AgmX/PglI C-terminal domain-containing protein n=1 Tax=Polyangium jinanense TaxID=2829994 RepID=A0A9X4AQR6_9BACT|nr:AgmX/PglI C-terminal domain-containing protein [Polyangium jinanense]MDC3953524.1 AgmX/PglI C-terminal domain-containing protein [Polyangium jinanense]MDC3979355.1 AgmX/PglI C-terminal domain-containing protein [Polyangium jinanense]
MRACATASFFATLSLTFAALFSACASGSPPEASSPEASPDKAASGETAAPKEEAKPGQGASPADQGAGAAAAPPPAPRKAPEKASDCKDMLAEITNEPPASGVVMNNAQTAGDAGASDRFQPMSDLIKSKRDAFRCCFDLWAKNNPGQKGKVAFTFELAPDGRLKEAKIKREDSDITAPEIESCMQDVAKGLTYPKSPSGKDTIFTYPFEFKARR